MAVGFLSYYIVKRRNQNVEKPVRFDPEAGTSTVLERASKTGQSRCGSCPSCTIPLSSSFECNGS